MRTMTISVDAHKFGFKTSVSSLLLRDGNSPPALFLSTRLINLSSRYCLLCVCCIWRGDDGTLISFIPRALTLLSSTNIVAIKVKSNVPPASSISHLTSLSAGTRKYTGKTHLPAHCLQPFAGQSDIWHHFHLHTSVSLLCDHLQQPANSTPQTPNRPNYPIFP